MIRDTEGYICETVEEIVTILKQLEDNTVSVWAGKGIRHSFETGLSINGKLEKNHTKENHYRIVVSEGSYAYFKATDVISLGVKNGGFKDGAVAVIEITF